MRRPAFTQAQHTLPPPPRPGARCVDATRRLPRPWAHLKAEKKNGTIGKKHRLARVPHGPALEVTLEPPGRPTARAALRAGRKLRTMRISRARAVSRLIESMRCGYARSRRGFITDGGELSGLSHAQRARLDGHKIVTCKMEDAGGSHRGARARSNSAFYIIGGKS